MQLQLLDNGSVIRIDCAKKYESLEEDTTLYKTRKEVWVLHTGYPVDRSETWKVISETDAHVWLIKNDHAEVVPQDEIDRLET